MYIHVHVYINTCNHTLTHTLTHTLSPRPGNEVIYGFSEFASTLNEPEEGVAPTDSRLRPDQRIMEQGDFDRANKEKVSRG